ncbi:MAG TPA: EamA/RhaT family transporter [Eoetvoesiella sp.]|uniref:EamA/RhaT family transporter n=1 Tax=Eoetvoesiella sp. TaxID=1966355 RepID=UPI002BA573FF|nr:EamA/RhaT family transporter [Eoetvoesiella sp.]HWK61876.1 EamA/RhaT family transporter [Eoetvoesiella sp.]
MLTLAISIACSVAVSILLKLVRRYELHAGQAIAVNYVVAATLCLLLLPPSAQQMPQGAAAWLTLVLLGVLLPTVFLAMAASIRHTGIVLSDAAQRLSLFLPLMASFLLFGETPVPATLAGVAVALAALCCLLVKPRRREPRQNGQAVLASAGAALLLAVWTGYGAIDILFKQLAKSGTAFPSGLLIAFTLAGLVMFAGLCAARTAWRPRNLAAGLVLGLLNFSNIYFYIRAHQSFPANPALVFTAMNLGVIALGTLAGMAFFKEKPSLPNLAGVALAAAAILILLQPQFSH